ncbi:MAG: hypothetical protein HYZ53_08270 [Planctomycetes bacterium]|nr:hypothetical protein [Planctomycetota bacterium]
MSEKETFAAPIAVEDYGNACKYVRRSYELLKRVGPKAKTKDLARNK